MGEGEREGWCEEGNEGGGARAVSRMSGRRVWT